MRSNKLSVRFFPFSPGIPWKIKNGRYIVPELSYESWKLALNDRNAIVTSFGGLIEAFTSLCLLEAINYVSPQTKTYWCGDLKFKSLVAANGLAAFSDLELNQTILQNYPVPLFMDQEKNVYFNVLNNYIEVKTYHGAKGYHDKKPILRQILRNTMMDWDDRYIPHLRNLRCMEEFGRWAKTAYFQTNRPYVCVFPDRGMSRHACSTLNWTDTQLKAFAAMVKQQGFSPVVFTDRVGRFAGSVVYALPVRLDLIAAMLPNAAAVLSEEVDYLMMANLLSTAKLISRPTKNELSLQRNNRFLKKQNVIYTTKNLTPLTAFNAVCGNE